MCPTYSNTPLSIHDIIRMLRDNRGLIINDEPSAERQLSIIGYFRLANYMRPMESDKINHIFKPGSTFENAIDLYYFDKELRTLIFTAIQSAEVGIRALMSHPISMAHGAFWYLDPALCFSQRLFADNIANIQREVVRSKEDFIKDHFVKHPGTNLPSWKVIEILSFGTLSKVFSNLADTPLKKSIARSIGLPQHKILESWLQALSGLRNNVAHHSRVWNKVFPSTPTLPKHASGKWISNTSVDPSRLYAHLCCVAYLQNHVHPQNDFAARLKTLLAKHPNVDLKAMGFPSTWETEPLWNTK